MQRRAAASTRKQSQTAAERPSSSGGHPSDAERTSRRRRSLHGTLDVTTQLVGLADGIVGAPPRIVAATVAER